MFSENSREFVANNLMLNFFDSLLDIFNSKEAIMNRLMKTEFKQSENGRSNPWLDLIAKMGEQLSTCDQQSDGTDAFVSDNYVKLREHRFFAALVPAECGGGAVTFA